MRTLTLTLLAVALGATTPLSASDEAIAAAVAGEHRQAGHVERDRYRRPAEVLAFCGLTPEQQILEIWPGGGWYADILAPLLRDQGQYEAAIFGPHAPEGFRHRLDRELRERFAASPEVYGTPALHELWPPEDADLGAPARLDAVYTFRNLHNWLMRDQAAEILAAVHAALRPGGTFCVVDHRADARMPLDEGASSGYVDQAYAIQLITGAGFELVAVSDLLDNPRDTADHPQGVWTLPPSLRMGEEDRERYLAIGESDRFLMRFVRAED